MCVCDRDSATRNFIRAVEAMQAHQARCRWCRAAWRKDRSARRLCPEGVNLERVIRLRGSPDGTPEERSPHGT